MNERLCIEGVGVDLKLYVHAHRHDVDLTIKASLKLNYSFGISSSYIRDLAFCNRGSDHVPFKYHFACKFKRLSSVEQYPSPTSTLICHRVLPPLVSRDYHGTA